MSYVRRPNPRQHWVFTSPFTFGSDACSLVVVPQEGSLYLDVKTRNGGSLYVRLSTEDEETFRRLLNERHKAREVEAENLVPQLYEKIDALRRELIAANSKLKEVLGEPGK